MDWNGTDALFTWCFLQTEENSYKKKRASESIILIIQSTTLHIVYFQIKEIAMRI